MRRGLLVIFLTLLSVAGYSQYYTVGSDPWRVRWNIMRSENFRVIYPRPLDSLARVYLYEFEKARPLDQMGMKISMAEMPLVLHPYTIQSNATVAWAPRRVDIFTTP
ncbi:MAG: hypothetical protein HUJ91_06425, partial [Bacteroidales bacterium]|nr:hypothetical protein [Bacteroidales bacterium]